MAPWHERVVAELCELRPLNVSFAGAWRFALALHPPYRMWLGPDQPNLLDEELPVVEVLRLACEDAWHGRRDEMRDIGSALASWMSSSEGSVDARSKSQRISVAA